MKYKGKFLAGRKRKRWLGLTAFLIILVGTLFLAGVGTYAFLSYRKSLLSPAALTFVKVTIVVVAAISGLALILSIVTFFRKNQKKGMAVAGLILALPVFLGCATLIFGYRYVLGALHFDAEFAAKSREELIVADPNRTGEVIRDTKSTMPLLSPERIQELKSMDQVEFVDLSTWEMPKEARAALVGTPPKGPSYLTGDYEQVTNFLLMGCDAVNSADSVMIFSLDRVHHKLKIISVSRDSFLVIPDWNMPEKLAYTSRWGGQTMTTRTLNYNFSLNIEDYIAVSLDELADIIDSVGGLELELTQNEADFFNGHSGMDRTFQPGRILLTGKEAALYARNRSDNEINRTARQRLIINLLLEKVNEIDVADYPGFIRSCLGMCQTSIPSDELLAMAVEVAQNDYTIESYALVENVHFWAGLLGKERVFFMVYNPEQASDWIFRTIYEEMYQSGYED